jgi:hypothetical protein
VEYALETIRGLIDTEFAFTPVERERRRVRDIVKGAGSIDHGALLRNSHLDAKRLAAHVQTLSESGYITIRPGGKGKLYEWRQGR